MRIPSGSTDRYIYFAALDATDRVTRETGLSSFTVYRSRNGAAAAAYTTPTINETDASNMPGVYELLIDEDTTIGASNDSEEMVVHITHAGMAPVTRTIELYRPKMTEGRTLTIDADGGLPWNADWDAEVQSEVQDAIEVNHLDHLLAVDYNPASKPGVSTALLNELVEDDGGVSRFTANAMERVYYADISGAFSVSEAGGYLQDARLGYTYLQINLGLLGANATEAGGSSADPTPIPTMHLDDTSGTNVFMRLALHDKALQEMSITDIDAAATGTISVREYGSGAGTTLFTDTFSAANLVNGAFEKTHANPGFTANKLYIAYTTVTADGSTYENYTVLPIGP